MEFEKIQPPNNWSEDSFDIVAREDTVALGMHLYNSVFQEHLSTDIIDTQEEVSCHNHSCNQSYCKELVALVAQYSASPLRVEIRRQVEMIQLSALSFDRFMALLDGLFQDGYFTRERVIVLCFFFIDILRKAAKESIQVPQIHSWITRYICEVICVKVEQNGGWSIFLQRSLRRVSNFVAFGVYFLGFVALCLYVRKNIKR